MEGRKEWKAGRKDVHAKGVLLARGPRKGRRKQGGLSAPVAAQALPCSAPATAGARQKVSDISHLESKEPCYKIYNHYISMVVSTITVYKKCSRHHKLVTLGRGKLVRPSKICNIIKIAMMVSHS